MEQPDQNSELLRLQPLFLVAKVFLLVAICGAGYLAGVSLEGGAVAGCGSGSGCNQVLSSPWAYWLGLPVSVPALGAYFSLLAATVMTAKALPPGLRWWTWQAIIALSLLILTAAIWFVLIQAILIKTWCKFCLATHASGSVAAVSLIYAALKIRSSLRPSTPAGLDFRLGFISAILGLIILVAGQTVVRKKLYVISAFSDNSPSTAGQVSLHHGQFKLIAEELPILGPPSASNLVVTLFDYTCIHCRALHPLLKAAREKYSGQLGIICLPVPLDAGCNPLFARTAPANQNSCEYAKLSLAVWHGQRQAFHTYDDWLFTSMRPPPLDQARTMAESLVGKEALEKALHDGWVDRQLGTDVAVYRANWELTHEGRLPEILIGDVVLHGAVDQSEDLDRLLKQHFPGLKEVAATNTSAHGSSQ